MTPIAIWVCLGIAASVWAVSFVPRVTRPLTPVSGLPWAAALTALVALTITYPSATPFAKGQGLGIGAALGSILAAMSAFALVQGAGAAAEPGRRLRACAAGMAPAVLGVGSTISFFRGDRIDVLSGFVIGWIATGMLLSPSGPALSDVAIWTRGRAIADAFAAALSFTMILTAYRGLTPSADIGWERIVCVVGTGIPAAIMLTGILRTIPTLRSIPIVSIAAGLLVIALCGRLAANEIHIGAAVFGPTPGAFWVTGIGLVLTAVGMALSRWTNPEDDRSMALGIGLVALSGATLTIPAMELMAGTGIGVLLLAAIGFAGIMTPEETERPVNLTVATLPMIVALLATRVIIERHSLTLRGISAGEHYGIIALILGLYVPRLFVEYLASKPLFSGRIVVIIGALGWPVLAAGIWGPKVIYGLVVGLGLSPLLAGSYKARSSGDLAALFAPSILGISALVQTAHIVVRYSAVPRAERALALIYVTSAAIGLILIAFLNRRARSRREA